MPIDTLKAAKRLQEEDTFSPEQAERIAEILSDLDVASATKEDLDEVEERLGTRIDEVEERLGTRIDHLETRMDERFEQVEERFKQVEERFEHVDKRFNQVDKRFNQVDKQFNQVDKQFNQVDKQFNQVDKQFNQVDEDMESMEDRLTQRVELSEERLGKQISELRSDMYRTFLIGLGAMAAFITIMDYILG
jgi:chromosome segregation ATPase